MFEAVYLLLKSRSRTIQGAHNWIADRVDQVLAAFIRKKLGDLQAFATKLTDRLLMYIFAVLVVYVFYVLGFYATQFLWFGYKSTYLGSIVAQGQNVSYLLADSFYAENDYLTLFVVSIYFAALLLPLLAIGRLFYLNRLFYEPLPWPLTSLLWGVPLAKLLSLLFTGGPYQLSPFIDYEFLQFLFPAVLVVHPAMQLMNWLAPEFDDLLKSPASFLRRLNVEREFQRAKNRL